MVSIACKWTRWLAIIAWLWCATACTSWILTKKDDPGSASAPSGLSVPAKSGKDGDRANPPAEPLAKDTADGNNRPRSPDSAVTSRSGRNSAHSDPSSRRSGDGSKMVAGNFSASRDSAPDTPKASDAVVRGQGPEVMASPFPRSSKENQTRDAPDEKRKKDIPVAMEGIKKYDHSRYVKKIRSKAAKLVEGSPSCFHARLCRDLISDEWWLTTYRKSGKTFSYTSWVWDDIDQKFERTFRSPEQPLRELKLQISYSAAEKECHVLRE